VESLELTGTDRALGWYAGRAIFVTGHTGFKGSWLSLWLHALGARVHGYSLEPPTEPSNFVVSRVEQQCATHHIGDVRDATRLEAALSRSQPDVIFHLAAQPLVREGYRTPRDTFEVNVMGTVGLLDAVRRQQRPCAVVVISSDKCYENREQVWGYREHEALGGDDPYSASKGAAELVVAAYRKSFFAPARIGQHGVRLASVRAGNVIGGGDWAPERIVTDIVRALRSATPVPVRNPDAVRPWQHVLEPLGGYLALAQRMATSNHPRWCSAYNFGPAPSDAVPVRRLVELFLRAWGGGSWEPRPTPNQPPEAAVLRLAIDKAVAELGWRPRWTVDQAISRTAAWFRAYHDGQVDMRGLCLADIRDYLSAGPEG
jgi:CDP-glucose 4,6-dehydratase